MRAESIQAPAGGAAAFAAHWRDVLTDAAKQWVDDRAMTLGSSLAYYTLFSLAPLVLFSIALAGVVFGPEQARAGVGASTVTVFGVAVLLFGASGAFVELQSALNQIWKVQAAPTSGVWGFARARLLSISAAIGMGFLLLVSLVFSSALSIVGRFAGGAFAWQAVNVVVSLAMVTLVFALVYRLLPDADIRWSDVWGGALAAALLFTLGKQLFSVYLAQAGVESMYGSAASVVVVLLWVYYSSLILLFGAEVAHAHATRVRPGGIPPAPPA